MADRILFIEATSGISGDMLLGALLDAGVPPEVLQDAWDQLQLDNYEVEISTVRRAGMRALRCCVKTQEQEGPRTWKAVESIFGRSHLKASLRKTALSLCRALFEIEGEIHGRSLNRLHLHEMGGTDLLLDVVGTLAAVDHLRPARIISTPVNTGHGSITFSHGRVPVPAPATAKLLEGIPVFQNEIAGELTTPTGALLLRHLAKSFGTLPPMTLQKVGVGAGERDTEGHPNVVRVFVGDVESTAEENVFMVESNVDDSNPQILAYFMEKAFQKGALDVFFTPIVMKKNRPAVRLSFLTDASTLETLVRLLFAETTAIGLRYWKVGRRKLERRWKTIQLGKARVRIKESYLDGILYNSQPEYEDCKAAAEKLKRPIKEVIAGALHVYLNKRSK